MRQYSCLALLTHVALQCQIKLEDEEQKAMHDIEGYKSNDLHLK